MNGTHLVLVAFKRTYHGTQQDAPFAMKTSPLPILILFLATIACAPRYDVIATRELGITTNCDSTSAPASVLLLQAVDVFVEAGEMPTAPEYEGFNHPSRRSFLFAKAPCLVRKRHISRDCGYDLSKEIHPLLIIAEPSHDAIPSDFEPLPTLGRLHPAPFINAFFGRPFSEGPAELRIYNNYGFVATFPSVRIFLASAYRRTSTQSPCP